MKKRYPLRKPSMGIGAITLSLVSYAAGYLVFHDKHQTLYLFYTIPFIIPDLPPCPLRPVADHKDITRDNARWAEQSDDGIGSQCNCKTPDERPGNDRYEDKI